MNKTITALACAFFSTTSIAASTIYTFDDILPDISGTGTPVNAHVDVKVYDSVDDVYASGDATSTNNGWHPGLAVIPYTGAGSQPITVSSGQKIVVLTCSLFGVSTPANRPYAFSTNNKQTISMVIEDGVDYELFAETGFYDATIFGTALKLVDCVPGIRKL